MDQSNGELRDDTLEFPKQDHSNGLDGYGRYMMLNGSAFADVDNSGRTGVLESRRFDTRSNVQCLEVWTNVEGENAELDVELWEADNVYGDIVRARYFTGVVPLLTDFFFPSNSILSKNSRNFMSPEHSWRFPDRKLPTW